MRQGICKLWDPVPWLWSHLAEAALAADPLQTVGPSFRAATARWRQGQRLRFRCFLVHYLHTAVSEESHLEVAGEIRLTRGQLGYTVV